MPDFELQAFHEMPKSGVPIIFSLSPVTTGIYVACIGSGVGISEDVLFISAGSDLLVTEVALLIYSE